MAAILFDVTVKAYVKQNFIRFLVSISKKETQFNVPKTEQMVLILHYLICSTHNTVFKTLTEAVRESEIRKHDPSLVLKESRSS